MGRRLAFADGAAPVAPFAREADIEAALVEHTRAAFDYEHEQSARSDLCDYTPQRVTELLTDIGLPRDWFRGKRVLDAGCGAGRWSYALAELGAQVVAVDLTESGARQTGRVLLPYPGCWALQSDLRALPAALTEFDLVFCWGVLHHTPDPRATLAAIADRVAPGGYLYAMLYGPTSRAQDAVTNLIRELLRPLSPELRYELCRAFVRTRPGEARALWPYVYVYDGSGGKSAAEMERAQFAAYDCYSPAWNYRTPHTEVIRWFDQLGFADVQITRPVSDAVHVRGRRPALPEGEQ